MNLEPGQFIDQKYRIERLLGAGGMGAVYEGENVRIRRRVAIKLLHAAVSSAADVVTRFEREAEAAGRIGSEHICEVLDLGVLEDGTRYMVMEYLDGETLSARIKKLGRMLPVQSIPIMLQVLEGLGAAHTAGIIHRDLKPDNIFLLRLRAGMSDFVKILDFGVSKFSQTSGEEMNVTRAGAVVGTPYYMSPEQARGMGTIDARSDIYALGVLLFQATTGQVPFQAGTFNELLFKIVLEPPPPPQQYVPDIDPEFAAIIVRAMSREPEHRFQSCYEFRDALIGWQMTHATAGGMHAQPAAAPPGFGRPQTYPPGYMVAPPPLGATPPFAATPPLAATSGGPQATANAWGQASGVSGATVAKKPNTALFVALAALVATLGGGGLAAYLWLGTPATGDTGGTTEATQQPAPSPDEPPAAEAPAAEPPAPAVAPAVSAEPPEELVFEETPSAAPAPEPPPAPAAPAIKTTKPPPVSTAVASPPPPRPTSTSKKPDFGY